MIRFFKNYLIRVRAVVLLGAFFNSTACGQEIVLVPDVDTLSLWGTCTPPMFFWSISHIDSVTDRIVINTYDVLLLGEPWAIVERYDSAYFEVRDTVRSLQYKLRYTHFSPWYPIDCYLPIDSLIYAENGPFNLTLYVQHNYLPADSAIMKFRSFQTGLDVEDDRTEPHSIPLLRKNYPNPFNPTTNMSFVIRHLSLVSLKVFDVLGKEVATLVNEMKQPGEYTIQWNGEGVPSGVYFYRIVAGEFTQTKKMVVLK